MSNLRIAQNFAHSIGRINHPRDGSTKEVEARRIIIITTGSKWKKALIPGGGTLLTPDEALEFKTVPKSMVILGGGFVGASIASIFSKLGTAVSIVPRCRVLTGCPPRSPQLSSQEQLHW